MIDQALLLLIRMSNSHVAIEDQSFDVLNTTPSSYRIKCTGIGVTFSTSDTLPSGFTLSSSGTLTYDGTNSDTGYFPFTVTVTKGEESATATITINLGVYEYTSVIFAAGVDTSIYFYNNNGVFTVSTDGGWGGTGYHQDLRSNYPWYSLYPKHGCKYSLDGGVTWNVWCFEDTNSTLDLSYTGLTSTTSFLKVLGRDSCYPSVNHSVYINDPSGGSAPYRFRLTSQRFVVSDESSSSSSSSSSSLSKVPTDYDWYTPYSVDYVDLVSSIAGTPAQSSAFSIATDNSKFGSGYLQVRKTTADNTGIEYQSTTNKFQYGTGSFAISYWIRTPYWNDYSQVVLGNKQGDSTTGFVIFKDYYDTMDMRAGANQVNLKSPTVAGIYDWHHYVFQRVQGGNWAWYKDGVLATNGTGATGSVTQSLQNFKVAGINNWNKRAYFDLAHVRIYGRALNSEEITTLSQEFDNEPSEIPTDYAFYSPLATDLSANGNRTGIASGSDASNVEITTKDGVNCAYVPFNASIKYPIANENLGNTPRTMSIWVYPSLNGSNTNYNTVFTYGTKSQNYYLFAIGYRTSSYTNAFTAYFNDLESSTSITTGWHNILVTYDVGTLKLYLDGTQIGLKITDNIYTATSDIVIGARTYDQTNEMCENAWFAGARIYNRVLTDAEIQAIAHEFDEESSSSSSSME